MPFKIYFHILEISVFLWRWFSKICFYFSDLTKAPLRWDQILMFFHCWPVIFLLLFSFVLPAVLRAWAKVWEPPCVKGDSSAPLFWVGGGLPFPIFTDWSHSPTRYVLEQKLCAHELFSLHNEEVFAFQHGSYRWTTFFLIIICYTKQASLICFCSLSCYFFGG